MMQVAIYHGQLFSNIYIVHKVVLE